MFRSLMQRLVVKFASSESRQCPDLPPSIEEFHQRFRIIMASSSLRNKLKFRPVVNVSDIDFHIVNTLIYSSLCSKHDRESYAYQLYLAYQQYPQALLNAVLTRMRQDQMISYKKCYNRSQVAQTCLPLSTSPFQLSVTYHHVFNFKYQYEIYSQAWQMLKQLITKKHKAIVENVNYKQSLTESCLTTEEETDITDSTADRLALAPAPAALKVEKVIGSMDVGSGFQEKGVPVVILHEGGYCATIVALLATKRIIFDITIPEQIIMMDQQQRLRRPQHQSLLRRFSLRIHKWPVKRWETPWEATTWHLLAAWKPEVMSLQAPKGHSLWTIEISATAAVTEEQFGPSQRLLRRLPRNLRTPQELLKRWRKQGNPLQGTEDSNQLGDVSSLEGDDVDITNTSVSKTKPVICIPPRPVHDARPADLGGGRPDQHPARSGAPCGQRLRNHHPPPTPTNLQEEVDEAIARDDLRLWIISAPTPQEV
ncbi:uncharacterized protein LOC119597535 [Penaeus monodon]|uniref:uncharacterized protein LOC119597535 n=1 Tax=Penaeus monodon TaxID=6687 RepID=UPI0018A782FB|nr:uncharacterized protein LOC119597535 [Penaeus monodon]